MAASPDNINTPYPGPTRRRSTPWLLLGNLAGVAIFMLLVLEFRSLVQSQYPPFLDILIARYVLHRWPKNWEEVQRSTLQYEGLMTSGRNEFDSVQIEPLDLNRCKVTFFLHNSIGWKYSEVQTLEWSQDQEDSHRREDERWAIAQQILGDLETWLSKGHPLTAGHFPAAQDVDVWNPKHSDYHRVIFDDGESYAQNVEAAVTGVAIIPGSDPFSIQVEFVDGVKYDIPSEKVLKRLPPAIAWRHLWRAPSGVRTDG